MRQTRLGVFGRRVGHSDRPAQEPQAGAPRDREQPRRKRRHRPQRSDAPVQQQQRFLNRIVDVGRAAIARRVATDIGLGR